MYEFEEGDIAALTTRKGKQFVGVYAYAPGIDYYWKPVFNTGPGHTQLTDPVVDARLLGKVTEEIDA